MTKYIMQVIYQKIRGSAMLFGAKYSRMDQVKFVEDGL